MNQFANKNADTRFVIVTPNFNMGAYLPATIESVLANLRDGDEYFIIDGGSTDDSVEQIKRYEGQLTGWISEKDSGYAEALAKGFQRGTAPLQCWINSGDALLPGALDIARQALQGLDVDLIFGDDLYVDENEKILQVSSGACKDLSAMMLFGGWTPLQDACYWRSSLYNMVGGLDISLSFAADYDLFLRMSAAGRCRYVPALFSAFRQHQGQKSINQAEGYRRERKDCRRRQLQKTNLTTAGRLFLEVLYGLLVRFRARLQAKNRALAHLVGSDMTSQQSIYFGKER